MSKRLVLVFCVLFALAMAVPAFAAVQNIKVSGDILARSIVRNNFDLTKGTGTSGEDEISVINSVVRVRIDADLTDNVSTVVRLINERNWSNDDDESSSDNTNTDIDLDLAYVTLKEFLYSPLTLSIGRQELHFGNDMIIGDGVGAPSKAWVSGAVGTNQTTNYSEATGYGAVNGDLAYRKAFDALRATLNYDPLVVDIVAAKISENNVTGAESADDIDLYGINIGYQFSDKWQTKTEAYYWAKINSDNEVSNTALTYSAKSDQVHTFGLRASTMPIKTLNLQQEFAYQGGRKALYAGSQNGSETRDRSAWAAQTVVMYTPDMEKIKKYSPTVGLIYSFFSGDANIVNLDPDKTWHQWDPMFENQTNGHIINALFPATNAHNIDLMLKFSPIEDVTMQTDYVYLAMASANSSDLNSSTAFNDYDNGSGYVFKANKKELGQELDMKLTYDYTEDVQFGLLSGWFWPGNAFQKRTTLGGAGAGVYKTRVSASEVIASMNVKF
jgi:hypothetical protein